MCNETEKAYERRVKAGWFDKYLIGSGIDIGCGPDILKSPYQYYCPPEPFKGASIVDIVRLKPFSVIGWDQKDGDAQYMNGVADESYDFVYSSHCLEHMVDPSVALRNWWRILKPGGYLVVVVPDEDLYEQGVWPSRGNGDHKTTWTRYKDPGESWSPVSRNLLEEVIKLLPAKGEVRQYFEPDKNEPKYGQWLYQYEEIKWCQQVDTNYNYELAKTGWHDQTGPVIGGTEAAVEAIVHKPVAR